MTNPIPELETPKEGKLDFLSHVSMQLTTPLSITREGLNHLLENIQDRLSGKEQNIFKTLTANLGRLSQTVTNLIDMHKIESGTMIFGRRELNIHQVLRRVEKLFESQIKAKGLQFSSVPQENQIIVYGNEDRIVEVFSILVANALEATAQGTIEITVEEKEKHVECFVKDTGRGVSPEDLPKMFLRFKHFSPSDTSVAQHSGLGLALAKGLVNLHQGKISMESELGKGTKVTFTLPKINKK